MAMADLSSTQRPKVFGIGCPRTGTTTLLRCMETLGYRHATWNRDLFHQAMVHGDVEPALRAAAARKDERRALQGLERREGAN